MFNFAVVILDNKPVRICCSHKKFFLASFKIHVIRFSPADPQVQLHVWVKSDQS
jgi:hypothetical protein